MGIGDGYAELMTISVIRDKVTCIMTRTARLFQLMQSLRSGPSPRTSIELAQDLGVSPRTIHRDIDSLRSLGAVIDGEAGFGFTLIEDATLPPLGFTDDELEALVLGLREVQSIGDPGLSEAASEVLRKLQGRLPPRQSQRLSHAVLTATRFDRPAKPTVDVAELRRATWDEQTIEFSYWDAKGDETRRSVNPLSIVYMDRASVLISWCLLRQDFRVFRLDRMQEMQTTGASFRPNRVPLLREALNRLRSERKARDRDSES
ncbi:Predicted DNA-binding transcriptional regulator YafY, contains an HTH and WYL domains [Ruegeria faecimaris]|uniref:Predicted DNA-binding transcriptional regulator YafY, contains an HTH and WYL domains n=2 Tax=Ruegeria faecimaris TaxID=686389 RepID=A0A521DAV5_9RHOB|nr:Predicted DNA-binding transcriptional regulator YafY, contains an HTH and WYL domains [Ruegeria faecimaris]